MLDTTATSLDSTYNISNVMWTIIEANIAVVCGCLPALGLRKDTNISSANRRSTLGIPMNRVTRGNEERGTDSERQGDSGFGMTDLRLSGTAESQVSILSKEDE